MEKENIGKLEHEENKKMFGQDKNGIRKSNEQLHQFMENKNKEQMCGKDRMKRWWKEY